jgi:uncharacterized protein YqhQ
MTKKHDVGGQAVIEGVMMRSKRDVVTAVRKNGKIICKHDRLKKKSKFSQAFFIRGIVNLFEMLVLGIKTLNWSASKQTDDDEELSDWAIVLTMIVSFAFAILLFVFLPYALTYLTGVKETNNPIWFNLIDGIIKVGILVLYVYLISRLKDVKRVFQYHGAEHKAVFCYEAGKELTVKNAMKYSTLHPRCGTAFIMIVILIGIFLFSLIPIAIQSIFPDFISLSLILKKLILFPTRILFLPIIAGFGYEILKFGSKHQSNPIFRSLTLPGLWIQKITTQKPNKKQIEVALFALKKVLKD